VENIAVKYVEAENFWDGPLTYTELFLESL